MTWHSGPLRYTIGSAPLSISKVKHGVTELSLSDGQTLRLSLHVESVSRNAENKLDIAYSVVTEVMPTPDNEILDIHETVQ